MSIDTFEAFKVERIVEESWNTKSFYLRPDNGAGLPPYQPGQHLLFKLPSDPEDPAHTILRFYTLSDCFRSKGGTCRISVKREAPPPSTPDAPEGQGSAYLHDMVKVGDVLMAKGPTGDFVLDPLDEAPLVLIGGGIGITPILAMAHAVAEAANSFREVRVFLGMRNAEDHPFKEEFAQLGKDFPSIQLTVCYDESTPDDIPGVDFDYAERVSVDLLKRTLPHKHYQFYICGPRPMMDALTGGLAEWGVGPDAIFTESFGPATASSLLSQQTSASAQSTDDDAIEVTFAKTGQTHPWDTRYRSLLEFAEAKGVSISAGCLYGDCGTCLTPLKSGAVRYNHPTEIVPDAGFCLPCSCQPAKSVSIDA